MHTLAHICFNGEYLWGLKRHWPLLWRPDPQQLNSYHVIEIKVTVGTAVDILGFNTSVYEHIDIWIWIDQIQGVLPTPRVVDLRQGSQPDASFSQLGFDSSFNFLFIAPLDHVVVPQDPQIFSVCNEKGDWCCAMRARVEFGLGATTTMCWKNYTNRRIGHSSLRQSNSAWASAPGLSRGCCWWARFLL